MLTLAKWMASVSGYGVVGDVADFVALVAYVMDAGSDIYLCVIGEVHLFAWATKLRIAGC